MPWTWKACAAALTAGWWKKLGRWAPIPITYAGGANSLADLETVTKLGQGRVDLTIGSALDIFGGSGVKYEDCVKFNRRQHKSRRRLVERL